MSDIPHSHTDDGADDEPITEWLNQLPDGDSLAQRKIWERCANRIAREAKKHLAGVSRRDSDEEDVAIKVLNSLFQRLADGRQKPLESRTELWNLLLRMTRNKSAEEARRKLAQKRGAGRVRGESALGAGADETGNRGIDRVSGKTPDPQRAFDEAQQLTQMLNSLKDSQARRIALLRMANHSDQEIADILGCGKRTVQRRLEEIRTKFSK